jgi:dTDP-4-dehydrorhamnose reductase/selenocysteine lyase/cysteine desulfurase
MVKMERFAADIEAEFGHIPHDVAYFNSAGHCVLPHSSQEVGIAQVKAQSTPWNGYGDEAAELLEVRQRFSDIINSPSVDCIGMCHSTSLAMSTAAHNALKLNVLDKSSKVVVLGQEMGSGILPWQVACETAGAHLCIVGDGIENVGDLSQLDSFNWTDEVLAAMDASVRVVCVPNVHWCDGAVLDLARISARIQEYPSEVRPWLVIDGTQSIGVMPFDSAAIKPTFVACSIHKWLCGPFGMSMTYLDATYHHCWTPIDQHDRNRVGCEQVEWDCLGGMQRANGYPTDLYRDARCANSGGHPNPITISMLRNSLNLIVRWDVGNIYGHCMRLNHDLTDALRKTPAASLFHWKPQRARCGHILGLFFDIPAWKAFLSGTEVRKLELGTYLCKEMRRFGVHVVMRGGSLRISVYVFTSSEQCSLLANALSAACTTYQSLHASTYNILVTGAAGWLAQFVWKELKADQQQKFQRAVRLFGSYHNAVPDWVPESDRVFLDFSDPSSVDAAVLKTRPDCVIHLAAMSSVVACETNPDKAFAVNACEALITAIRSHNPDCVFIFSSTDLVYDGNKAPYSNPIDGSSSDMPAPVNIYGSSKLQMEKLVTSQLPNGVVLRLSNMIGPAYAYKPAGTKFLQFLNNAFMAKEDIGLKDDEKRSFVYVMDVVKLIQELCLTHTSVYATCEKVFNVGGPDGLSRLQLADLLCKCNGSRLLVQEDQTAINSNDGSQVMNTWKVHRMVSEGFQSQTGPASPMDVTMESSSTFARFGIAMSRIADAIPLCL